MPNEQVFNKDTQDSGHSINEQDYKNLQAFATRTSQQLTEMVKKVAETNPAELRTFDEKLQKKVIKDVYGYTDLEELEIAMPELFTDDSAKSKNKKQKNEEDYNEDENEILTLRKEFALHKKRTEEREFNAELSKAIFEASLSNIDGIENKIIEELKYISKELPIEDRIKKAISLITANFWSGLDAYVLLQGKTIKKTEGQWQNEEAFNKKQALLRRALWLTPNKK